MRFSILRLLIMVAIVSVWLGIGATFHFGIGLPPNYSAAASWALGLVVFPALLALLGVICVVVFGAIYEFAGFLESKLRPKEGDE